MKCFMKIILSVCLILSSNIHNGPVAARRIRSTEKSIVETADEIQKYLDGLLKEATSTFHTNKLDPVDLPDIEKSFKKKIATLNLSAGFQTFNGSMYGLSSLHRDGDIYAIWERPDIVTVSANMAFSNLHVEAKSRAWLGKLRKTFSMAATIKTMKVNVQLDIPVFTGEKPRVSSFNISDMSRVKLDFKGLGPLNWILEGLGFILSGKIKKNFKEKLGDLILKVINEQIRSIQLPSIFDLV